MLLGVFSRVETCIKKWENCNSRRFYINVEQICRYMASCSIETQTVLFIHTLIKKYCSDNDCSIRVYCVT